MGNKLKSLASVPVLGFALLAFGPSTSTAKAEPFARHGAFHGRVVAHRSFAPIRHRAYVRPFHTFAPRVSFAVPRPYRLVRVFVYAPYPHWVLRRVYSPYYAGASCPY